MVEGTGEVGDRQINNSNTMNDLTADGTRKRVLLVNPAMRKSSNDRIHMGLTLLGQILVSNGHEVKVIDYAFLGYLGRKIRVPRIEEVVQQFEPQVIGITAFTDCYTECQTLIEAISSCCSVPIILGGPHFVPYPDDFSDDRRISYICRGEAERVILNLVETAKVEQHPVVIDCPTPSADEIPEINLDIAYGHEYLKAYQIQLSRGCPFNCSFCNTRFTEGRKVRARDLDVCLNQIIAARGHHPQLNTVVIVDDCPSFNLKRFKRFLQMFREANTGCKLVIDNVRADLIDEEMLQLYKAAGGRNICLGVESGAPKVFELIHKGESLEDIVKAAKLVRKYRLLLGLCFVIGLPEDNLEHHLQSMRLAKALKPNYIFWNMFCPLPGTEARQWYEERHREIRDLRNFSTLIDSKVSFIEPPCDSEGFLKEERIKAWLMANLETHDYFRFPHSVPRLIVLTHRYRIYRSLAIYLSRKHFFLKIMSRAWARGADFLALVKERLIKRTAFSEGAKDG